MGVIAFAIAFAVSRLVPSLLKAPFPPFPLARAEDAFTLLPPLFLVPLSWWLLRTARGGELSVRAMVAFLVVTTLWVDGHGMHDSANSIGNVATDKTVDAYRLTYFWDEEVSHYVWDSGLLALSALLVWTEWRYGGGPTTPRWMLVAAGLLYGVTCFLMFDEGQTVPLGLPFSIAFVALAALMWRRAGSTRRLLTFFATGYGVAALMLIGWGIYWRGFPQLSDLGLL